MLPRYSVSAFAAAIAAAASSEVFLHNLKWPVATGPPSRSPPRPPPPPVTPTSPLKPPPGAGSDSSSSSTRRQQGKAPQGRREFNDDEKKECWQAAALLPGRDPSKWRVDIVGNPVCHAFNGKQGVFGFEYDHIHPYSRGGLTTACQILQTRVNRAKSNKFQVHNIKSVEKEIRFSEMSAASPSLQYGDEAMDIIEAVVYGNIDRTGRKCKVLSRFDRDNLDKKAFAGVACGLVPEEDK